LRAFRNGVLRGIHGHKREQVKGERKKSITMSFTIVYLQKILLDCQIKENAMDKACSTHDGYKNTYTILERKHEGKMTCKSPNGT
jgi:hypothetical protein